MSDYDEDAPLTNNEKAGIYIAATLLIGLIIMASLLMSTGCQPVATVVQPVPVVQYVPRVYVRPVYVAPVYVRPAARIYINTSPRRGRY